MKEEFLKSFGVSRDLISTRTCKRSYFENRCTDMSTNVFENHDTDMDFFENRDMEISIYKDLLGLECGRFKSLSLLSSDWSISRFLVLCLI